MADAKQPAQKTFAVKPVSVDAGSSGCKFEGCKKNHEKFSFCHEHYELYMAGVIRGDGKKPLDYEVKLAQHQKKTSRAA